MKRFVPLGAAALFAVGACTSQSGGHLDPPSEWIPASAQLASYDDCGDALEGIQRSVLAAMTAMRLSPMRQGGDEELAFEQDEAPAAGDSAGAADGAETTHSETNNAVAGVDEPDIVKTDGDRLYTVVEAVLRVVDPEAAEVVAEREYGWETWGHRLFLGEDELLVMYARDHEDDGAYAPRFVLERLDKTNLEVLDAFTGDGAMLDARMVDGQVRLALQSSPAVQPLWQEFHTGDLADLREAVHETEIEDWLPEFAVNGQPVAADCGSIAHPERFGGQSTVSVLSLPVGGDWSGVEPVTVMADGGTVHGTSDALYLAHADYDWDPDEPRAETEVYRFVFDGATPRPAGAAAVAGTLLNQYSMSEHDGHLRLATTEDASEWWWGGPARDLAGPATGGASSSTVTVLEIGEDSLTEVGSVGGLGEGERIYAVRFLGDTGYVVTFRQTDPLYTVDLSDPSKPEVTGELKITGYSAYLHPVGDGRLLGVGQEATEEGVTTGLQVSLFDVTGAEAGVLDQYEREGAQSAAEWDPHGFLYWEPERIAVLPVWDWTGFLSSSGAAVLEVGDDSLTEAAWIEHEVDRDADPYASQITRSLVVGGELWTLSGAGLMATELGGDYGTVAWVDF